MVGRKSQSQRLRATLYLVWWQHGGRGNFEDYYDAKMEAIIEAVKKNLNEGI